MTRALLLLSLSAGLLACGPSAGGETHWTNNDAATTDLSAAQDASPGADASTTPDFAGAPDATVADSRVQDTAAGVDMSPFQDMANSDAAADASPDTTAPDMVIFDLPLVISDQVVTELDLIVVDGVMADQPSLVVIRAGMDVLAAESVTEFGALAPQLDLPIRLSRPIDSPEMLQGELWLDLGQLGVFEPGTDTIVTSSGRDVRVDFTASAPDNRLAVDPAPVLELSTMLPVAASAATRDALLVALADDGNGAPDFASPRGAIAFNGAIADAWITVDPPATDGETFHVAVIEDTDGDGLYDAATERPLADGDGRALVDLVTAAVPQGTPAVRVELLDDDPNGLVLAVVPSNLTRGIIDLDDADGFSPDWELISGWRYEVVNSIAASHPFELHDDLNNGLVVQGMTEGVAESDITVNWTDDQAGTVRFTVTAGLVGLTGYRCSSHPTSSAGQVTVAMP